MWLFAHRFHAELTVGGLLAPFLIAAPSWEREPPLATQIADGHRPDAAASAADGAGADLNVR